MKITLITGTVTEIQTALDLYRFLDGFSEDELNVMHLKTENADGEIEDLELEGVFVEEEHLSDKSVVQNLVFMLDIPDVATDETRSNGPRR